MTTKELKRLYKLWTESEHYQNIVEAEKCIGVQLNGTMEYMFNIWLEKELRK